MTVVYRPLQTLKIPEIFYRDLECTGENGFNIFVGKPHGEGN
jgi:hypothetical protein